MTVKKGSRVQYRIGSGWAAGKVVGVKDGKAQVETASGYVLSRNVDGLIPADSTPPKTEAKTAPAKISPKAPAKVTVPAQEVDDEDDCDDEFGDDEGE